MSIKRIARLKKTLREQNLDALVVSNLNHIRYLSGFTGSSGLLVVDQTRAFLFTDSRYATQSKREGVHRLAVPDTFVIFEPDRDRPSGFIC